MEPFPISVLQILIEVFVTTTKICIRDGSIQVHALGFVIIPTAVYSSGHRFYPEDRI